MTVLASTPPHPDRDQDRGRRGDRADRARLGDVHAGTVSGRLSATPERPGGCGTSSTTSASTGSPPARCLFVVRACSSCPMGCPSSAESCSDSEESPSRHSHPPAREDDDHRGEGKRRQKSQENRWNTSLGLSRRISPALIVYMRKVPLTWDDRTCLRSRPHQPKRHFSREDYRFAPQDRHVRRRFRAHLPSRRTAVAGNAARHRPGPGPVGATAAMATGPRDPRPRQDHR